MWDLTSALDQERIAAKKNEVVITRQELKCQIDIAKIQQDLAELLNWRFFFISCASVVYMLVDPRLLCASC